MEGDLFLLRVLNETLTYQVDRILIVLPNEMEDLMISKGRDYCTLVTCTPYGVNTHRLLVRGRRIENEEIASVAVITSDAIRIDPILVAPVAAVPMLVIVMVIFLSGTSKRKPPKKPKKEIDSSKKREDPPGPLGPA